MDVDHGSGSVKYCCSSPSITTLDRQVLGADCFQCGRSDEFIVLLPPSKTCRLGFRYWELKADSIMRLVLFSGVSGTRMHVDHAFVLFCISFPIL